ncbi:VWA domain-containing protein [Skermania piniformis]|uniref:Substrate-binding and VWA domain-containing protein n=1 Tax=Skermania pinensis TaxID=39122 RepID=A0ABX8S637_9ACTN|nr:substrate-binding domain-containing protein [Skermania piniformis]QXQ12454.1 substrate-binding and VWA domain-containing protein [Skermania piniformis]
MARHRGPAKHRGGGARSIARGPLLVLVTLGVLAALAVGWMFLRDRIADDAAAAARQCVAGDTTLAVTADPDIAGPVRAAAQRYGATHPVVRDHCAQVEVTDRLSGPIAAALPGPQWDAAALGPRPALWIADSSRSVRRATVPGLLDGEPKPIATTPVVFAVAEPLRAALDNAKAGWADLAGLQQGDLDRIGLVGWGGLRLAVPPDDATLAVAEAVATAALAPQPVTAAALQRGPAVTAVSSLAVGAPPAASAADGITTLRGAAVAAAGAVHAVPTTELQLRGTGVVSYRPPGPGPIADYPAARLTGPWIDETQNAIAAEFVEFLTAPEQARLFTDAGFVTPTGTAAPAAERAVYDRLADILARPTLGVSSTLLVDVSASMGQTEGNQTRLANVVAALRSQLDTVPPSSSVGLWTYRRSVDGAAPYRQQTATQPLTTNARSALNTALAALRSTRDPTADAYRSLVEAYRFAMSVYQANRANSVLLITDGSPDDESAAAATRAISDITAMMDPARPVRIDVLQLGTAPVADPVRAAADRTGGQIVPVASSAGPELATALTMLLG